MMTYSIAEKVKSGFTLLELMIAIAIIGILAAIGVPAYNNYAIKARASELLTAAAPYQLGVDEWVETTGAAPGFANYPNAVTLAPANPGSNVAQIKVLGTGVVTVTGTPATGNNGGATAITLTPTVNGDGSISWACTSTCAGCTPGSSFAPATCH